MVRAVLSVILLLSLPACTLTQGEPAFRKPKAADLDGLYTVTKASWGISDRRSLKKASLSLNLKGDYDLDLSKGSVNSPLFPATSGRWRLVETSGIDIASGMSWGIRFESERNAPVMAYLLNASPPHRILFFDRSRRGDFGDSLIFEKRQPAGSAKPTD
jgi:hypothetical protein